MEDIDLETFDIPLGTRMCPRCDTYPALEPHLCPYAQEFSKNKDNDKCTCCTECCRMCAEDI